MLTRHERKQAKARARWKRYVTRRNTNRNVKKKYRMVAVNEKTLKMWAKNGYSVQLAPKSRRNQELTRKEAEV
jgi:hypothetical protein